MPKGFMLKLLQGAVVFMFVLVVFCGLVILFKFPDKMDPFREFVNIIFPVFLSSVVPALIGGPLTDAVRNLTAKKEGGS